MVLVAWLLAFFYYDKKVTKTDVTVVISIVVCPTENTRPLLLVSVPL